LIGLLAMSPSSVPVTPSSEAILQKIAVLSLQVQRLASLETILNCAVEGAQELLHCDRVFIYQFSQAKKGVIRTTSTESQPTANVSQLIEAFSCQPQWLEQYQQGGSQAIDDIFTQALDPAAWELCIQSRVHASLSLPILVQDRLWGLFIAHQWDQPRQWQALDRQILQQFAVLLGIALQHHDRYQPKEQSSLSMGSALQHSEYQHRAIVEDQTEMIARFSWDSTILFVNDAYCRYFGVEREDVIGKSYKPVVYNPDQEIVTQHLQQLSLEKPTITIENRVINAQGEIRWTQWVNRLLVNELDQLIEFQTVGRDITELKQAEERFRIVQELSLDAFTILKSIRDNTGNIVDFEWTYANPRAAEILKHSTSELIGHRLLEVLPGNQADSELFKQYVHVVETGVPHDVELFYNAEGITGWFRNMTVKLDDGIAISFSDITERKQTEVALRDSTEQLQEVVAELQQLNRTKDEFLSTVSHELRTPMTNIKMSVRMLELGLANPHSIQRDQKLANYLKILSKECDREINLINDLLDLQQLESGRKNAVLETSNFYQWLTALVQPFQERAMERQQFLVFEAPTSETAEICCDFKSLERILSELLNNACKYTPPGQQIILKPELTSEQLQIQVTNFGTEIPAQALPYIFDRFYRVPSADPWKQGGTGLGLALVKKLAEYLNGTIHVESGSGHTCFWLKLALPPNTLSESCENM